MWFFQFHYFINDFWTIIWTVSPFSLCIYNLNIYQTCFLLFFPLNFLPFHLFSLVTKELTNWNNLWIWLSVTLPILSLNFLPLFSLLYNKRIGQLTRIIYGQLSGQFSSSEFLSKLRLFSIFYFFPPLNFFPFHLFSLAQ